MEMSLMPKKHEQSTNHISLKKIGLYRCYVKSTTVQDTFQPMQGFISYAGVTMHASDASSFNTKDKHLFLKIPDSHLISNLMSTTILIFAVLRHAGFHSPCRVVHTVSQLKLKMSLKMSAHMFMRQIHHQYFFFHHQR